MIIDAIAFHAARPGQARPGQVNERWTDKGETHFVLGGEGKGPGKEATKQLVRHVSRA